MNIFKLKPHPFSQMLPPIHGMDRSNLFASIKKQKKNRYPIIVYQNMILDGNQRVAGCLEARVEPKWIEFKGSDAEALDLAWDLNIGRRQLNASEKATAVARFTLEFQRGRPDKMGPGDHLTEKLADKAGVGMSTVKRAKIVLREGTKDEIKALETGEAKAKPLAEAIKKREAEKSGQWLDDADVPVPDSAREYWNRKPEAKNVLNQIRAAKGQVKKLMPDDPLYCEVNLNGVLADLESAINRFSAAIPAHVCPYCKGQKPDGCKCCKGRGVVSKFMWSQIPDDVKKKLNQPF